MSTLVELQEKEKCKLEMTPMIDVTFLLLIFFMCTLKFKTLEGKLSAYLPKDVGVNPQDTEPLEKVDILVRVVEDGTMLEPGPGKRPYDGEGRFVFDTDRVLEYSLGTLRTNDLETLSARLKKAYADKKAQGQDEIPVTIDARYGTIYSDVVEVLDEAIEAGFRDITFVGAFDRNIR